MRSKSVDAYMEQRFGKPDFSKTFYNPDDNRLWTPMGNRYRLWRVDPLDEPPPLLFKPSPSPHVA